MKPGNLQRHYGLREGAKPVARHSPCMIRVKGAFEIMPFLMYYYVSEGLFI
jgi:hypothetical protein